MNEHGGNIKIAVKADYAIGLIRADRMKDEIGFGGGYGVYGVNVFARAVPHEERAVSDTESEGGGCGVQDFESRVRAIFDG